MEESCLRFKFFALFLYLSRNRYELHRHFKQFIFYLTIYFTNVVAWKNLKLIISSLLCFCIYLRNSQIQYYVHFKQLLYICTIKTWLILPTCITWKNLERVVSEYAVPQKKHLLAGKVAGKGPDQPLESDAEPIWKKRQNKNNFVYRPTKKKMYDFILKGMQRPLIGSF